MKSKREEKNKISKERILKASIKEFGEKDYSAASINSICKNNNISKGLLFHYYKNKDEIFLLCVEKFFVDLSAYLDEHFELKHSKVEDNLRDFIHKRFEFFKESPYYLHIFHSAIFNPPKHLIHEIKILREPLKKTNIHYWRQILNGLDLKENVDIEDVIGMSIGIGEYLHMKVQHDKILSVEEELLCIDKYTEEYIRMIEMLFYGIVK